jgi:protein-S-isoprenylcysteine O-methyltransferase Ste14
MINILKNQNGMNIIGQGGKIILFMLPSLIAAIWAHTNLPQIAALPDSIGFIKLVTTGPYSVVRNPIYSSVTFFVLPAVALITLTWVYFVPSIILYVGVMIFIGREEGQLAQAFGKEYIEYLARVDRLVPFKKP